MTRYPNLLAEYQAGNGGHISTFCDHANVTEELMKAIFYHNEDLELNEAFALCQLLNCNMKYLYNQQLLYFKRRAECQQLVEETEFYSELTKDMELDSFERDNMTKAIIAARKISRGEQLPYAYYRAAVHGLKWVERSILDKALPRLPRRLKRAML